MDMELIPSPSKRQRKRRRPKTYPRDIRTLAKYLFGADFHGKMEAPTQRQMVLSVALATGGKLAPFAEAIMAETETSVVRLMQRYGITYHDIVNGFRQMKLDEGMLKMYEHVPQVMEDVAKDALSKTRKCKRCHGTGHITRDDRDVECDACDGTGTYLEMGDAAARKLIFDAAGLTAKSGVQINQQFNTLDGGEALETLVGSARTALTPARPIPALPAAPAEEVTTSGD